MQYETTMPPRTPQREGLDHGRLQLLLFGAAFGPLVLTMALLFIV